MKYLCLVCLDQEEAAKLSPSDWQAVDKASMAYDEELRERGLFITAAALKAPETAATVRVRNGKRSMTDGPFIETKEHVAGFILIEARDLNEALDIAAGIPLAKLGCVEVRPLMDFG